MRQCVNGHFYDEKRTPECPYCKKARYNALALAKAGEEAFGMPADSAALAVADAAPVKARIPNANRANVSPQTGDDKTVGLMRRNLGIDPPVGFLVCSGGPHKGEDYRLFSGNNYIGRSAGCEAALTNDAAVVADGHAIVTFDAKRNAFYVFNGTSKANTTLNGTSLNAPAPLSAYDVIGVGESELVFLPLCGSRFSWVK